MGSIWDAGTAGYSVMHCETSLVLQQGSRVLVSNPAEDCWNWCISLRLIKILLFLVCPSWGSTCENMVGKTSNGPPVNVGRLWLWFCFLFLAAKCSCFKFWSSSVIQKSQDNSVMTTAGSTLQSNKSHFAMSIKNFIKAIEHYKCNRNPLCVSPFPGVTTAFRICHSNPHFTKHVVIQRLHFMLPSCF